MKQLFPRSVLSLRSNPLRFGLLLVLAGLLRPSLSKGQSLTALSISPSQPAVDIGGTTQLAATATYSDGSSTMSAVASPGAPPIPEWSASPGAGSPRDRNRKRCHQRQLPGTNCLRLDIQFHRQYPMERSSDHHPGRHLFRQLEKYGSEYTGGDRCHYGAGADPEFVFDRSQRPHRRSLLRE